LEQDELARSGTADVPPSVPRASANDRTVPRANVYGSLFQVWRSWGCLSPGKKRLLGEAMWIALGQVVSASALLLGIRLLTEFVPPEVFGTVSLLIGISTLGATLFCNPMLQAALRFYPDLARQGQTSGLRAIVVQRLSYTCGILIGMILVGGASWSNSTGASYGAFVALAALLVCEVFSTFETGLLGAARRQRAVTIWKVVESCARPGLGILAVLALGATPAAMLSGYAAATACILLGFLWFARREYIESAPMKADARKALADEIRRYARPLIPLAVVAWITALGDRYLLAEWAGPEDVGVYAATYGLISRPFLMAGGILLQALRPVYYDAVAAEDRTVERRTIRLWIGATAALGLLGVISVYVLREHISAFLLGAKYRSGADLMPILAIAFSLQGLSFVYNTIGLAHKKPKYVLWSEGGAALATIGFGVPLIATLHLWGAAIATLAAYAVQALLAAYLAGKLSGRSATIVSEE